jgi:hypothetical protein
MAGKLTIISNEKLIAFIKGELDIKPSGRMNQDARALGFQGKKPVGNLSKRLNLLIESGDLTEAQVKGIYKRFREEHIEQIPAQLILDFIQRKLDIKPSGRMNQDARALGFQGVDPRKSLCARLKALIEAKNLTEAQVKSIYPRFEEEHIKEIPDQGILDFIHGRLDIKPSGNLAQDARALGFQGKSTGAGLSYRLKALIAADANLRPLVEGLYTRCNWSAKVETPDAALDQAAEEGMGDDESRVTFNISAARMHDWKKSRKIDDARAVPREEFLAAVRATASLADAAVKLGLTEPAVLRRASRYMKMDVIKLENTPSLRWEEAHMPAWLPADSPAAVLVCAKQLIARFNGHAKPSIIDVSERLKVQRETVEQHIELLIAQGLLAREQLAQPEMAV